MHFVLIAGFFLLFQSVWGSYWYAGQWGYRCCHSLIKESYCTGDKGKANAGLTNTADPSTDTVTDLPEVPAEAQIGSSVLAPLLPIAHTDDSRKSVASSESDDEVKVAERARQREEEFERSKERRDRRAKKRKEKKTKSKSRHGKKHKKRRRSRSRSSSSNSSNSQSEDEEAAQERRVKEEMEKEKKRLAEVDRILAMDERQRPYHSLSANDGHVPTQEEMEAYYRLRQNPNDPLSHFKD